jgi:hypothetical protein
MLHDAVTEPVVGNGAVELPPQQRFDGVVVRFIHDISSVLASRQSASHVFNFALPRAA